MNLSMNRNSNFIYELDDVFQPKIDIYKLAVIFYTLEGMKAYMVQNCKEWVPSSKKLFNDIIEYHAYLSHLLAQAIYDYTVGVVYGEMRYASQALGCNYASYCPLSYKNAKVLSLNHPYTKLTSFYDNRGDYSHFIKYSKFYSAQSIRRTAEIIFNPRYFAWCDNYGGKSWLNITNLIRDYEKLDDIVFVDRAFDTQHNSGVYLDKDFIFSLKSVCELTDFLNDKKFNDILDIIRKYSHHLDHVTSKLVRRFAEFVVNKTGLDCYRADYYFGHNFQYLCCNSLSASQAVYGLEHREPIQWGSEDFMANLEIKYS